MASIQTRIRSVHNEWKSNSAFISMIGENNIYRVVETAGQHVRRMG